MADYGWLWDEARDCADRAASEWREARALRAQASAAAQVVARLEAELRDLEDFGARVQRDRGDSLERVAARRRQAQRLFSMSRVQMARDLGQRLAGTGLPQMRAGIEREFDSIQAKVRLALGDVERELAEARRSLAGLEARAASHESNAAWYEGCAASRRRDAELAQMQEEWEDA